MTGPTASSPSVVAPRSKRRLSIREDRERPNGRTPSTVSPSTSSNWTVEPTTSSIRGSTLTRTPIALAMRISSTTPRVSVVVGTTMMRSTCSSCTRRATASGLPTRSSSPTSGSVAMTAAWALLV